MNTDILRVTLLQTDIAWEDKEQNLHFLRQQLDALRGTTDLIILPETFSTGFTSHVQSLAEPITAATIGTLQQWATQYDVALTGSFLACDDVQLHGEATHYYNRAFFLTPDGCTYYYDKRHLFRLGGEGHSFTAGSQRPVISYRSWNILLQVCYDLCPPVPLRTSVMYVESTAWAPTVTASPTTAAASVTLPKGKNLSLLPTMRYPPSPSPLTNLHCCTSVTSSLHGRMPTHLPLPTDIFTSF